MTADELRAVFAAMGTPNGDRYALAAYSNHAQALVDLVEACEALDREWSSVGVYTAIARVRRALARVHEVKP